MYTTRRTVNIARAVSILAAVTAYFVIGAFFDMLLGTGHGRTLCGILAVCAAACLYDVYTRRMDYVYRMAALGAGHGLIVAGIAVLAAGVV